VDSPPPRERACGGDRADGTLEPYPPPGLYMLLAPPPPLRSATRLEFESKGW
jgi:hypothetical protein